MGTGRKKTSGKNGENISEKLRSCKRMGKEQNARKLVIFFVYIVCLVLSNAYEFTVKSLSSRIAFLNIFRVNRLPSLLGERQLASQVANSTTPLRQRMMRLSGIWSKTYAEDNQDK